MADEKKENNQSMLIGQIIKSLLLAMAGIVLYKDDLLNGSNNTSMNWRAMPMCKGNSNHLLHQ